MPVVVFRKKGELQSLPVGFTQNGEVGDPFKNKENYVLIILDDDVQYGKQTALCQVSECDASKALPVIQHQGESTPAATSQLLYLNHLGKPSRVGSLSHTPGKNPNYDDIDAILRESNKDKQVQLIKVFYAKHSANALLNLLDHLAATAPLLHLKDHSDDHSSDLSYVINKTGELIEWNSNLEKFCGLTREQMLDGPVTKFICEEDWLTVVNEVMKGSSNIEVRFIRHDGTLVPFMCNGEVLKNTSGDVIKFTGIQKTIQSYYTELYDQLPSSVAKDFDAATDKISFLETYASELLA